jgi:hypothetical protein
MFKKSIAVSIIVSTSILLMCACQGNDSIVEQQLIKDRSEIEHLASSYVDAEIFGINLLSDISVTVDDLIYMDKITDDLHVTIASRTSMDFNCEIKLLLDYIETEFWVNQTKCMSYSFQVKAADNFEITINLSEDINFEQSHILTVIAIPNNDKHKADGFVFKVRPLSKDFELTSMVNRNSIKQKSEPELPNDFLSIQFSGLMLNTDFAAIDSNVVNYPPENIEVVKSEIVKLAYRVGNYEKTNNVLFYVLCGGKQLQINEKPFMHLINKPGKIAYGTIEFIAPENSGKYEVFGFVTSAPYEHRTKDNASYNDYSALFTITVI